MDMKDPSRRILLFSSLFIILCSLPKAYGCGRRERGPNNFASGIGSPLTSGIQEDDLLPSLPKGKGFGKRLRKKSRTRSKPIGGLIVSNIGAMTQTDKSISEEDEDHLLGDMEEVRDFGADKGSMNSGPNYKGDYQNRNNFGRSFTSGRKSQNVDEKIVKPKGRAFVQLTATSIEEERTSKSHKKDRHKHKNKPKSIQESEDDYDDDNDDDYYEDDKAVPLSHLYKYTAMKIYRQKGQRKWGHGY